MRYFNMGPWPYFVGVCKKAKRFRREMKRLNVTGYGDYVGDNGMKVHFLTRKGHNPVAIITVPDNFKDYSKEQVAALLAHEALHVVVDMREILNNNAMLGEEAECYIVQQIVQESMQYLYKTGRTRAVSPS